MSDPTYKAQDFLQAELIVDHLLQQRSIQFQLEDLGRNWGRERTQKHFNERAALIITRQLLLDEADRLRAGQ